MIDAGVFDPWRSDPDRSALFLDFDGTLAPIVPDPGAARPLPAAVAALGRLAGRLACLAVVSGRPVRFLAEQLSELGAGVVLVGLYGLEWTEGGAIVTHPGAELYRDAVAAAAARASAAAPPGVMVEDKGLAVTIHARLAPETMGWVKDFGVSAAEAFGLASHGGRLSVELRAPLPVDKGTVVLRLSAGMAAACYIGDDRGDLPAFDALARLRAEGLATLAVAATSDEAPPELLAAADLVVDGPEGAIDLLGHLTPG